MPHNPPKEKVANAGEQKATYQNNHSNPSSNSSAVQRQRLLAALRKSPMSTLQIRRELDILGVAPRVLELRRAGHKIITNWQAEATEAGKLHRVALYVLLGEAAV